MDILDVIVIFDKSKYSKEDIVEELKQEGFRHNFYFYRGEYDMDVKILSQADEVWQFGECVGEPLIHYAKGMGKEIWRMG